MRLRPETEAHASSRVCTDLAVGLVRAKRRYEVSQIVGGFEAERSRQQFRISIKDSQRLRLISLGQVHLDKGNVSALSKRIDTDGGSGSARGLAEPIVVDEKQSEGLERTHPKLLPVFCFGNYPIVRPVGEQFVRQRSDDLKAQITRLGLARNEPPSEELRVMKVNFNVTLKRQPGGGDQNCVARSWIKPSKRGPQAETRSCFGDLGPHCACDSGSGDRPIIEREEDE